MKITVFRSLFFLFLPMIIFGCAKTPPPKPASKEDLRIQRVIPILGYRKSAIFERAKIWMKQSFSNDLDVIQYANSTQGVVRGKTSIPHVRPKKWSPPDTFDFRFNVTVEAKNERMRVTMEKMHMIGIYGVAPILGADMDVIRPKLEMAIESLADSFNQPRQDDNW